MSTPRDDPIVSYADFYPPAHWEYIQEQRGDDSTSDLWVGMTNDYHAMLEKATKAYTEHLEFDHQTTKTSADFCLDPTDNGPATLEMWRTLKEGALERSLKLHTITEEEEPEEPEEPAEVEHTSQEVPELEGILPEQPALEKAVVISVFSVPEDEKAFGPEPIGHGLPWESIFPEYSPGYATSVSTSSTGSKSITWAPLPDTSKPPRKPSHSRRLRQSLGFLRGLVCCWN